MSALKLLEEWNNSNKAHAVEISHDDGYGASCWEVKLFGSNKKKVVASEVSFWGVEEKDCPEWLTFARPPWVDDNDESYEDWPGLEKTILAALKRAEELGL